MNQEFEHQTPSETTDLPECEICGHGYVDLTLTSEEAQIDFDSIKDCSRCDGCKSEYGETMWPDW